MQLENIRYEKKVADKIIVAKNGENQFENLRGEKGITIRKTKY